MMTTQDYVKLAKIMKVGREYADKPNATASALFDLIQDELVTVMSQNTRFDLRKFLKAAQPVPSFAVQRCLSCNGVGCSDCSGTGNIPR